MYEQLVQPDLSAVGQVGWCLQYASRNVYHNPAAGTTAWNAWLATQFKHTDANLPNVPVLMWYSGAGGAGHVTINIPGQGIYSSPYNSSFTHNVLSSIQEVQQKYGVTYVGWSEDILGLRVAQPQEEEIMPNWNDGDIVNAKRASTGVPTYQPTGAELEYFKQPEHSKDLLYDTIKGMEVQIDLAKKQGLAPTKLDKGVYEVD